MALELRELIEEEDAMMRQGHLPGHGDLAPTDQADVRDGVVRGTTQPGGDTGGTPAGEAGDAVDARSRGLRHGHHRQDGDEPPRQH
jgi:hypothetical protein